jgi:hypothetical protein
MKFCRVLTFVASLLLLAGAAFSQNSTPTEQPFFFPKGIQQTTEPLKQRVEYEHLFQATWVCTQGQGSGISFPLVPGSDSITVTTDVVSTSSVTEPNTKMKITIDHAYRLSDGRIRYTSLCDQYFITEDQLKLTVDALAKLVVAAAERDNEFYQVVANRAVEVRAQKLGIKKSELEAQLDEKVPGYNITFRELHRLPKPSKPSDFVPRELHLGYNPPLGGILGVTWLNTGVIYYNPEAWMTDYITTVPKIMQHEMVHANINFEKFPLSEAFDVELMADMPIVLYPENRVDFQSHGYARDLREYAEIYFGFDWDQYQEDTVKFNFEGNIVFDDTNYLYYHKQIETIKAEMLKFYMNVTIPEFYSDPMWWSAVNDIRGDDASVFRMTLALHYNPTLLGGAKPTMEWLNAHSEEIEEIAKEAFAKGLAGKKGGPMVMVPPYLVDQYNRMFTDAERKNIEAYFTEHPEKLNEIKKMSPADLMQFLGTFKTAKKGTIQ